MNKIFKIGFSFLAIISMGSCSDGKKDQVYPKIVVATCDTTTVTYAATVAPILSTNCISCHGSMEAASSGGGIILDNYTAVKGYVTNGKLYNAIMQNGQASPMPKNRAKMDACTINKIAAWINRGAYNN